MAASRKRQRWGAAPAVAPQPTAQQSVAARLAVHQPPGGATGSKAALQAVLAKLQSGAPRFGGGPGGLEVPGLAPRMLRRMYVGGLNPGVTEASIKSGLSEAMKTLNFHPDSHGGPVLSFERKPTNPFGFAEFTTPDAATAAMSLTGSTVAGCSIRVQRPREFNEAMGAPTGGSGGNGVNIRDKGVPDVMGITGGDPQAAGAAMVQCTHTALGFHVQGPRAPVLPSGLPPNLDGVPRLTADGPELRLGASRVLVLANCMSEAEGANPVRVKELADAIVHETNTLLAKETEQLLQDRAEEASCSKRAKPALTDSHSITTTTATSSAADSTTTATSSAADSTTTATSSAADSKPVGRGRGFGYGNLVSHKAPHAGKGEMPVPPPPSPGVPGQLDSLNPTDGGAGTSALPPGVARPVEVTDAAKSAAEEAASQAGTMIKTQQVGGGDGRQPKDLVGTLLGGPLVRQRWPHPEVPGAGRVFLEFDSAETAVRMADALAGRSFNGRILVASFLGERAYDSGHFWGWGYAYGDGAEGVGANASRTAPLVPPPAPQESTTRPVTHQPSVAASSSANSAAGVKSTGDDEDDDDEDMSTDGDSSDDGVQAGLPVNVAGMELDDVM